MLLISLFAPIHVHSENRDSANTLKLKLFLNIFAVRTRIYLWSIVCHTNYARMLESYGQFALEMKQILHPSHLTD